MRGARSWSTFSLQYAMPFQECTFMSNSLFPLLSEPRISTRIWGKSLKKLLNIAAFRNLFIINKRKDFNCIILKQDSHKTFRSHCFHKWRQRSFEMKLDKSSCSYGWLTCHSNCLLLIQHLTFFVSWFEVFGKMQISIF